MIRWGQVREPFEILGLAERVQDRSHLIALTDDRIEEDQCLTPNHL
jgi:hypothetical protein